MTVNAAARKSQKSTMMLRLLGAAAQLAVAVHPRVGSLDQPAVAGLDGCGLALRAMSG